MKLIIILLLLVHPILHAKSVGGIDISQTKSCGGTNLPLQSTGLRTATIFAIKIYVLAIYAAKPEIRKRPICFDITYLRDFDEAEVDKAWKFQFDESSGFDYPRRAKDIETLNRMFGSIKGARNQRLELLEGVTRIYENDQLKGEITGEDFQKSFISVWTGKNPPTKELQRDLLKTMSLD